MIYGEQWFLNLLILVEMLMFQLSFNNHNFYQKLLENFSLISRFDIRVSK
jgi:hypothetical protein